MKTVDQPRLHGLDVLRLFLMLLGIPFHAALIYSAGYVWMIRSSSVSPILTDLAAVLHSFRMPAFFLLSGFFAALVLQRREPNTWICNRILQLVVPLLVCTILMTPPQIFISLLNGYSRPTTHLHDAVQATISLLSQPSKYWVLHLWFLIDLLLISILFFGVWPLLQMRQVGLALDHAERLAARHPHVFQLIVVGCFLGMTLALQAFHALLHVDEVSLFSGLIQVQSTLYFAAFFLFGACLRLRPGLLLWFQTSSPLNLLAVLVILVLVVVTSQMHSHLVRSILPFLNTIAGVCVTRFLFSVAMNRFDHSHRLRRSAADAAFTVYLVHHPVIVGLGFLCVQAALAPLLAWCIIVLLTAVMTLSFHVYVVAPSRVMSLLLNGRIKPPHLPPLKTQTVAMS